MAVVLDSVIGVIQWLTEHRNQRNKRFKQVRLAVIVTLVLGVSFSGYSLLPKPEADFVVGGKAFTEQYIISGLITAQLEAEGFVVDQRLGLGSQVIYSATANNTIDVYLEYTGTIWANRMNNTENPGRTTVLNEVTEYVEEEDGMVNIGTLGFQNLYSLAMRKDRAEELGINTIEDMVSIASDLVAAGDLEFFGRPEWITLRDTYNIDFKETLTFDPSLMYTAVDERQVDLIVAYTTDGRVAAYDLLLLEDSRNTIIPYDAFLLASSTAAQNLVFVETMQALIGNISEDNMQEANRMVDLAGRSISEAVAYLQTVIP